MKRYLLRWKFHKYNIELKEVGIEDREQYFDKFEDLLTCYREKKNALFSGCINYNTDFKVYTAIMEQQDIKKLDAWL